MPEKNREDHELWNHEDPLCSPKSSGKFIHRQNSKLYLKKQRGNCTILWNLNSKSGYSDFSIKSLNSSLEVFSDTLPQKLRGSSRFCKCIFLIFQISSLFNLSQPLKGFFPWCHIWLASWAKFKNVQNLHQSNVTPWKKTL